jgi:hypothetical protein
MKITNILLGGIFAALIFIGIHRPAPIVLPAPASSVKWEYTVQACDDDSREMREYERTHPDGTSLNYDNEFSLIKIQPDGDRGATRWELCAWFLEPKSDSRKLILIFKRPVD